MESATIPTPPSTGVRGILICLPKIHLLLSFKLPSASNYNWCFSYFSKLTFFFQKFFQVHYQSVKQFGSRSGSTECWAWSGSKQFSKITSRLQKLPLAGKDLTYKFYKCHWRSSHYAVTHMRNRNSNIDGRSPNVVKVIYHTIKNSLCERILSFKRSSHFEKGRNLRESLLDPVVSLWCA